MTLNKECAAMKQSIDPNCLINDLEAETEALSTAQDVIPHSLYLHKRTSSKDFCSFKGVEIKLKPRQFEALFKMAKDPGKSHQLDISNKDNCAATENERKIVERINLDFKKAGFENLLIVNKIRGKAGYKINTEIIAENRIFAVEE